MALMSDESSAMATTQQPITLELTYAEAEALSDWMLKPASDGSTAIDDPNVKPGLVKLRNAVEYTRAIGSVRQELESAGFQTGHMSDSDVAALARRLSATPLPTNG
jgi:hypothetical protein